MLHISSLSPKPTNVLFLFLLFSLFRVTTETIVLVVEETSNAASESKCQERVEENSPVLFRT